MSMNNPFTRFGFIHACLAIGISVVTGCDLPEPTMGETARVTLSAEIPVKVTGGQIQGALANTAENVISFKGIPYAAPPVGTLRWRPPEPVLEWTGVRDAELAGPICMQAGGQDVIQSEDCLLLNVWAPRETDELLPVMVWIHGGALIMGSGKRALSV